MVTALSLTTLLALTAISLAQPSSLTEFPLAVRQSIESNTTGIFGPDSKIWGEDTPYFPLAAYVPPPSTCEIDQVNILQRHGARYPKKSPTKAMKTALKKLQSVTITESSMQFIANFTYSLGEDDLVPFGAQESYDAGEEAYQRYLSLVSDDELPFVRASSSSRVVDSAGNWTAGFAAASNYVYVPVLSVIISEDGNDTLDDASCPAFTNSDSPGDQEAAWISIYTPNITDYLNAGAPGAGLTNTDTQYLIELCPFVSVATEERSEWCDLFSSLDVFPAFEYYADIDKYYGDGYGQGPLGPAQGIGYLNELLARLTDTPVNDSTSTNTTLDSDPATFPLGRTFYADFTHDDILISVYTAMGLFPTPALNYSNIDDHETSAWQVSRMTPFAGRMVTERMGCDGEEYVRVLVNQAVQPMPFCGSDADGLCSLSEFVESQAFARNSGYGIWETCFD